MNITFNADDKLICPYQNEVENISIKNHGTSKDIYFIPVKLNNEYYLEWSDIDKGWVLKKYGY